jgi:hypothetical protein
MLNRLRDVFACLQKHDVRYVVIGGIAAVLHGVPRATFDLDILIEATMTNVQNLLDAFLEAKLGTAALTSADEIIAHEISIFQDRIRIDVQTRTPGIEFARAWENKIEMNYQGQSFFVLCKNDLIAAKSAAGREVDLQDVKILLLDQQM